MTSLTKDRVADRGSPSKCWLYHQLLELWASVHVKPWGCVLVSIETEILAPLALDKLTPSMKRENAKSNKQWEVLSIGGFKMKRLKVSVGLMTGWRLESVCSQFLYYCAKEGHSFLGTESKWLRERVNSMVAIS